MADPNVPQLVKGTKKSKSALPSTYTPELLAALETLNQRVCVVKDIGKVVEYDSTRVEPPNPLSFRAFQFEMYANVSITFPVLAQIWVKWKGRKTVKAIVYEPGQDLFCGDG